VRIKRKAIKVILSLILLFGITVAFDEVMTLIQPDYQIVYADDIIVSKETKEESSNYSDFVNPKSSAGTYQPEFYVNYLYLSTDGKTRYLQRMGRNGEQWYVWKADDSNEYGGTWNTTSTTPISKKTKSNKTELAQIFENKYGYAYTSSPSEIKAIKEGTSQEQQDNQASANQQSGAQESSNVSQDDIDKYNGYISLGDKPTPATLLASIILKGGNNSGIDKANISLDNIAKYPAPTTIKAKIKGEDVDTSVYEYGNINDGTSNTIEGGTTANIIKVLTRYGWLTTNNDNENKTPWYVDLLNNITNPIYAVGSIVATVIGSIADTLSGIFQAVIDGAGTVIGWLLPVKIFGIVTEQLKGVATSSNWFTDILKTIVEALFGKGDTNAVRPLLYLFIGFAVVFSLFDFGIRSAKNGIKDGILAFKNMFAKLAIWLLGLAMLPLLYTMLSGSAFTDAIPTTDDLKSEISFNSEKFFIATNGDISVLYPNKFSNVKTSRVLSNSELDKTFKPTPSDVAKANETVENLLGSELSAQIDEKQNSQGTLDGVVNNSTWNVNDYLTGIETAGKQGADGTLNTQVTANRLPSGLSWNSSVTQNHMTVSVTPTNSNGDNIQDTIKQGWFLFKGLPVWFDSIADSGTSEEVSYVSAGGWTGIKFSQNLYKPTQIDLTKTQTYLYGATSNNNDMTLNVSNYTFYSATTLNNDLMKSVKYDDKVEDGENVRKTNQDKNGEVTAEISSDLEETKSPLTTANVQWRNAYMIAMFNKYAGTSARDINGFVTAGNMGFSNQSTMILLQSIYSKNKMSYFGYNTPNSKSDNSKAQTKDNVYMTTYSTIGTGTSLMNTLSRTSYGLIARAIVMFGITVCVFQYGLGIVIKDSWVYFYRWLSKGSATGLIMVIITTIYYFFIFNMTKFVSGFSLYIVGLAIDKIGTDGNLATTSTFGIGLVLVGLALALTWRYIKFNGRKTNFISLFFMGLTIGYDILKGMIERLDVAIYEEQTTKTKTQPSGVDEAVSRRVSKGGGLVKSALGSFIGNTGANRLDDVMDNNLPNISTSNNVTGDSEGTSTPNNSRNGGGFSLPLGVMPVFGSTNADEAVDENQEDNSSIKGVKGVQPRMVNNRLGKILKAGKKVTNLGALASLATPFGWGTVGYLGMRGAFKGYRGLKQGTNALKESEFGRRLGLNGRKEQLKSRYGLASDDDLVANIKSGTIRPRKGEQSHFDDFVKHHESFKYHEQAGTISTKQKEALQKMNAISRKTPAVPEMVKQMKKQEAKDDYIKNNDVKIKPSTKVATIANAVATGNLINHIKKTVPQRRESYLRQQAKAEFKD